MGVWGIMRPLGIGRLARRNLPLDLPTPAKGSRVFHTPTFLSPASQSSTTSRYSWFHRVRKYARAGHSNCRNGSLRFFFVRTGLWHNNAEVMRSLTLVGSIMALLSRPQALYSRRTQWVAKGKPLHKCHYQPCLRTLLCSGCSTDDGGRLGRL